MKYLRVKNWESFQHYKDRSPPWIKLHRDLLNDYDFGCLQDASKLHLMLIWLLASQMDNKIPADEKFIKSRTGIEGDINLNELIEKGFLVDDSNALASCKQVAIPETEAEERQSRVDTLDALQIDDVSDWLEKKRIGGKYLTIDEHALLEKFKNYCRAKNPKYKDYAAAFKNSFEWDNAPKKKKTNGSLDDIRKAMEGA